ncbi:hypothetical protein OH805_38090 [Streptomyces sp. NBC_00879]|uniref:hypothetical protein n=1 Tax=Streptomyces sp. NBC_00879 TaxID=2975855 RepID=UPI003863038F|nr:hypothetical protein OH805_38090 [Streptomyces sp. NBC_00879]
MDHAYLFISAARGGRCVAVIGSAQADVGRIAYEVTVTIKRVDQCPGTLPRQHSGRNSESAASA